MRPSRRLLFLAVVFLLLAGPAFSQSTSSTTSTPSTVVSISSYWGYTYRPYRPSRLDGAANVIRAEGDYLVKNEEARLKREEVRQARLENRRKELEQWRWEIDFSHETWPRQREIRQEVIKFNAMETLGPQIWNSWALNELLEELIRNRSILSQADSRDLPPDLLKHINLTTPGHKNCHTGLLKEEALHWPSLLRLSPFKPAKQKVDEKFIVIRQKAGAGKDDFTEELDDLRQEVDTLLVQVNQVLRSPDLPEHWSDSDFIEAKRYLKELNTAVGVLWHDARAIGILRTQLQGKTVAELVIFMDNQGFLFAPANEGDKHSTGPSIPTWSPR